MNNRLPLLFIGFLLSGCEPHATMHAYPYQYIETTGITTFVISDGKSTPIHFTENSCEKALHSLTSLNWQVLYPNANNNKIFVVGRLHSNPQHTPSGIAFSKSEEYFDFTLINWYITLPFDRAIEMPFPEPYKLEKRITLTPTDFKPPLDEAIQFQYSTQQVAEPDRKHVAQGGE